MVKVMTSHPEVTCWSSDEHITILVMSLGGFAVYVCWFPYYVSTTLARAKEDKILAKREFVREWGWAYMGYGRACYQWYAYVCGQMIFVAIIRTCLYDKLSQIPLLMTATVLMGLANVILKPYASSAVNRITILGYTTELFVQIVFFSEGGTESFQYTAWISAILPSFINLTSGVWEDWAKSSLIESNLSVRFTRIGGSKSRPNPNPNWMLGSLE